MTSVQSGGLPMLALLPFLLAMGLFTIQPWSFQVGSIPMQVVLAWLSAALFMVLRVRTVLRLIVYVGVVHILLVLVMTTGTRLAVSYWHQPLS